MTTLTNAVSGQSQNCSGNLEISPGIGTLGNFSGKHAIIPGHCKNAEIFPGMYPNNSGGQSKFPGRLKLRPSIAQTAFVRVVIPRMIASFDNKENLIILVNEYKSAFLLVLFDWHLNAPPSTTSNKI